MNDTSSSTELYSYDQAWTEAARLQSQGYVTRVWFDGWDWRVTYMTHEQYFAGRSNDDDENLLPDL